MKGSYSLMLGSRQKISLNVLSRICQLEGQLGRLEVLVSNVQRDGVGHSGGDDVVGAEQLVLQVDQNLGPEVAVVEGELNVAVIQISGNGFAAGAEVDNLTSEQDLHVPGGEGQAQLTVDLLVDASDEDMKENF